MRSVRTARRVSASRPGRIWGLIAAQAASHGGLASAGDACVAAAAAVGATGAWLTAGRDAGRVT